MAALLPPATPDTPAALAARITRSRRLVWRFDQPGLFAACDAAERFLAERGFSVGGIQGPEPHGILFGRVAIQKWRNLRIAERAALHGQMSGSMRNGPVTVVLFDTAPAGALAALERPGAQP